MAIINDDCKEVGILKLFFLILLPIYAINRSTSVRDSTSLIWERKRQKFHLYVYMYMVVGVRRCFIPRYYIKGSANNHEAFITWRTFNSQGKYENECCYLGKMRWSNDFNWKCNVLTYYCFSSCGAQWCCVHCSVGRLEMGGKCSFRFLKWISDSKHFKSASR